jgi:hypothetical protein
VWAAVEHITAAPTLSARALGRHDSIVRRLAADTVALAPARFGMVTASQAALVRLVEKRAEETARVLNMVKHREQMTVRLFSPGSLAETAEAPTGALSRSRTTRRSARRDRRPTSDRSTRRTASARGPGTRYLQERAAREMALRRELVRLRAALGDLVVAEQIVPQASGPLLGSVYHLVARGHAARYTAALAGHVVEGVAVTGPAPCYAFAGGLRL